MAIPTELSGACHCGAVRFTVKEPRAWLTQCNCSICRRTRALWLHSPRNKVIVEYAPDAVIRYAWGDKLLAFISCRTCGCTTHWEGLNDTGPEARMAVNAAMAEPDAIAAFPVRRFDGAETWEYLD